MDAGCLVVEGKWRDDTAVLMVRGELDAVAADMFGECVAKAVADLSGPVVVDLSGLTFIDCAGVRALIAAIWAIPDWQPVTVACCLASGPARVLDLLSVDLERLRAEVEARADRMARPR
ncbi:MAG TPA: STAS domain-containing protein [Trebonia sp.]